MWKLLEVALDRLSLLTASRHYRFHDGLPVITTLHVEATLVLTASHHYCSHDDFQSSLLFPC